VLAAKLGPHNGPVVLFAAATGLRPGEWIALEHRDIDRDARVVYVRRAFRNGRLKCPKTEASVRAVRLQTAALAALAELPANRDCPLVFTSPGGGYLDLHNFRTRYWKCTQVASGITPRDAASVTPRSRPRPEQCPLRPFTLYSNAAVHETQQREAR
jgi:integrase